VSVRDVGRGAELVAMLKTEVRWRSRCEGEDTGAGEEIDTQQANVRSFPLALYLSHIFYRLLTLQILQHQVAGRDPTKQLEDRR